MDTKKMLIEGIIQDLIKYLCEDTGIVIEDALEMVYNAQVFQKVSDVETGLYRESPSYIYELLKDELLEGKFIQKEI
ncbi:MAG: hypothetical protein ACRDDX_14715 [Cellulosilyticaceae bacterium]